MILRNSLLPLNANINAQKLQQLSPSPTISTTASDEQTNSLTETCNDAYIIIFYFSIFNLILNAINTKRI